jgi:hypothetical protein
VIGACFDSRPLGSSMAEKVGLQVTRRLHILSVWHNVGSEEDKS